MEQQLAWNLHVYSEYEKSLYDCNNLNFTTKTS
jgi:hypothetical protein